MAIQLVFGGSGSGKSEYVQNLAVKLSLEDRRNNIMMVVPDQFTMQTQWQMANRHPDGGIINIDVLSFSRLPERIFEEVGKPSRMLLDDTGKCLLVRRAAVKCRDNLKVLSRGMDKPGWAEEVKSVISEFMQYGIGPEDFEDIKKSIKDTGNLGTKFDDLEILYKAFLAECESRYITREERLDVLCERIPLSKSIPKSTYIFDGFTGFTPIQMRVIVEIARRAGKVIITFPFENGNTPGANDEYLFDLTRKNVDALKIRIKDYGIELEEPVILKENHRLKNNLPLLHLERNLFRAKQNEKIFDEGAIRINKCKDFDNECHNLCNELFKVIEEKKYRYRDVAVVCGDMEGYGRILEKYLKKYGIPYYMDSNRNINANPLVKYIVTYVSIIGNHFEAEDVMKFLRTGLTPFSSGEIDKLENYIYARGIKGAKKYREPFEFLSEEMRRNEEDLRELNEIRERFYGLFEPMLIDDSFKKRRLRDWLTGIYGMLEATNAEENMDRMADEVNGFGDYVITSEYRRVYGNIMTLFEQLNDLMGEEEVSGKELLDILNLGFSEIRVGVLPQGVDSLLVGDMERTRLKEIKALFFIGVNDGNIPKSKGVKGLLSLPEREMLRESNVELSPTPSEQAFIEQLYLYLNVTKPTEYLYMSYATVGGRGESLVPSYFIKTIEDMYKNLKVNDMTGNVPVLSVDDIREETGRLLGLYVAGNTNAEEETQLFNNLSGLRKNEEDKKWCEKIIANAYSEYNPISVGSKLAKELYDEVMKVSISTLEKYAACRYSHFITYGLSLSEREEYGLEAADIGNLSHDVLENIGKNLQKENKDFSDLSDEVLDKVVGEAVQKVTSEYNGDLLDSDEKNKFYTKQLTRIMKRTVNTLGHQLGMGKFSPYVYEEPFQEKLDAKDIDIVLKGRIDRLDVFTDELTDEILVKVLDYKSSAKEFKPENLEAGISLQLAIYMKNAVRRLQEMYPDTKVRPAAMLYYKVDDPFVGTDGDSNRNIAAKLIPTGAVVNDQKILLSLDNDVLNPSRKSEAIPVSTGKNGQFLSASRVYSVEDFNGFLNRAEEKAVELSRDIKEGKIDINPLEEANPCRFCPARGICGFDAKIPGYGFRDLNGNIVENDEEEGE